VPYGAASPIKEKAAGVIRFTGRRNTPLLQLTVSDSKGGPEKGGSEDERRGIKPRTSSVARGENNAHGHGARDEGGQQLSGALETKEEKFKRRTILFRRQGETKPRKVSK